MAPPRQWTLLLGLGFCLALAFAFFFSIRAGRTARHLHWRNEAIQPWMSVPFVAHTYHTRSELLFRAIRVEPNPRDRRPIRDIARTEKLPVAQLIRDLENAITNAQSVPPSGQAP